MEPKLPSPDRGFEPRLDSAPYGEETELRSRGVERDAARQIERNAGGHEAAPAGERLSVQVPVLPVPNAPAADDNSATDNTATSLPLVADDTPATASDSERIEKEWVDKAKKVIAETKDDPYRREQEVGKLQADYIYKRYGRKLGSPQP